MLLYACFRFSEAMDQLFLTVLSAMQGSFRAMLGVASIFVNVLLNDQDGELGDAPLPHHHHICFFFFLRCCSRFLRWHLRPLIIDSYNMRTA